MFKRRIAALGAVTALLLAGGLVGSANASDEPPVKAGTCVTSDGKTFDFTQAVPAHKIEGSAVAIKVDDAGVETTRPEGVESVERWSETTDAVAAVPAQPAKPNAEGGGENIPTVVSVAPAPGEPSAHAPGDKELATAVTITCTAAK
ncbi:hypothetical protein GCM10010412_069890 [Nonomuraea recticatena]|uniref:Secreted protein n=1 Tax=Nonomuraea recticatena TaxID=46178 RepID=A0ABP6F954_9ACTN